MEISGQLHVSDALLPKEPRYALNRRGVGDSNTDVDTFERKKYLQSIGNRKRFLGSASSLVTISTALYSLAV